MLVTWSRLVQNLNSPHFSALLSSLLVQKVYNECNNIITHPEIVLIGLVFNEGLVRHVWLCHVSVSIYLSFVESTRITNSTKVTV